MDKDRNFVLGGALEYHGMTSGDGKSIFCVFSVSFICVFVAADPAPTDNGCIRPVHVVVVPGAHVVSVFLSNERNAEAIATAATAATTSDSDVVNTTTASQAPADNA